VTGHRIIIEEERDGRRAGIDMMFDPLLVDVTNQRCVTLKIGEASAKLPVAAIEQGLKELDGKFAEEEA